MIGERDGCETVHGCCST